MNKTLETFENFYLARKKYPQFFPNMTPDFDHVIRSFRTGYCYPLPDRDLNGSRVVLVRSKRLNMDENTLLEGIQLGTFILAVLMEEEETQIAGVKVIYDHDEITPKHLMMPNDVMDLVEMIKTTSATRIKAIIYVNLPVIAHFLLELFKNALSEKLRSRLFSFHSWDDLKNSGQIDANILPKELGGRKPESEILEEYEEEMRKNWDLAVETVKKSDLDWSKVPIDRIKSNQNEEAVGSFRKLEID